MNGYQPKLKCNNCVSFSSCNNKKKGKSLCKEFKKCEPILPSCISSVLSKTDLEKYKI